MKPLEVPIFVQKPSGQFILDIWPILTLFTCFPTLWIYWKSKRFDDLAICFVAFLMSLAFHVCYMHPEGLSSAILMGISGDTWRTYDVYFCFIVSVRTIAHSMGVYHLIITSLSNIIFPIILISVSLLKPNVKMSFLALLALFTMIIIISLKLLLENTSTFPKYSCQKIILIITCMVIAHIFLLLPHKVSGYYWLFHSLWHIFLAVAFHALYSELEGNNLKKVKKKNGHRKPSNKKS